MNCVKEEGRVIATALMKIYGDGGNLDLDGLPTSVIDSVRYNNLLRKLETGIHTKEDLEEAGDLLNIGIADMRFSLEVGSRENDYLRKLLDPSREQSQ